MQVVTHEVVADVEAAVQLFAGISEAQCKTGVRQIFAAASLPVVDVDIR